MEKLISVGRAFYAIAMAGIGFQLFYYGNFHPVIFPPFPSIPAIKIWAYLVGAFLIITSIAILFLKKGKIISLVLAGVLLALFCFGHIVYEIFVDPNKLYHLGLWTNALKELALSGGAFLVASTFSEKEMGNQNRSSLVKPLEKLIPLGSVFFSIMLICFGIDHFLYTEFVATLVPSWIPFPIFCTYFGGTALIASGVAILLKIKPKQVAFLLGTMLFIWLIILHIPRSVADFHGNMGNELTSAFTALAFSGIAFVISGISHTKKSL